MTSRVQKGGPIFRPVVKSRARPDVRQVSVAREVHDGHGATSPLPSTPIPPHPTLPTRISPAREPPETDYPGPELPSSLPSTRPPTLIASRSRSVAVTVAVPHTANAPTLITNVNHDVHITGSSTSTSFVPSLTAPPSSRIPSAELSQSAPFEPPSHPHILYHSGAENVPRLILDPEVVIKPQRTLKEKTVPISVNRHIEGSEANTQIPGSSNAQWPTQGKSPGMDASTSKPPKKRIKKNRVGSENEESNEHTLGARHKRKRETSSGNSRPRRSRAPSLPPFDPNGDPGEELDPTVVTMASLCRDTGQGRVSSRAAEILSNHTSWKTQTRAKRERMKALMELKKYGREEESDDVEANQNASVGPAPPTSGGAAIPDDTGHGFDYSQDLETSQFQVQVRIGPNGETVIDEESLVVDLSQAEDTSKYTHVVESDHTKFINSGTYSKRYRGSRWSVEETELFYDALSQYGQNYELMAYILPGRDRKSCKNKFKAEDRKNPTRINYCLRNSTPVDIATLSRMTGKDFSGPIPEIRILTTPPIIESNTAVDHGEDIPAPDSARKKGRKKKVLDDDAVIVGQVDSFEPFPSSL